MVTDFVTKPNSILSDRFNNLVTQSQSILDTTEDFKEACTKCKELFDKEKIQYSYFHGLYYNKELHIRIVHEGVNFGIVLKANYKLEA